MADITRLCSEIAIISNLTIVITSVFTSIVTNVITSVITSAICCHQPPD